MVAELNFLVYLFIRFSTQGKSIEDLNCLAGLPIPDGLEKA